MRAKSVGIRELKNNLSRIIRSLKPGDVIRVTDRTRVVAELRSATADDAEPPGLERYQQLVRAGFVREAKHPRKGLRDWPAPTGIRLPPGTVQELIDADRGD